MMEKRSWANKGDTHAFSNVLGFAREAGEKRCPISEIFMGKKLYSIANVSVSAKCQLYHPLASLCTTLRGLTIFLEVLQAFRDLFKDKGILPPLLVLEPNLKEFSQDRNWNSSFLPCSCLFLNLKKLLISSLWGVAPCPPPARRILVTVIPRTVGL